LAVTGFALTLAGFAGLLLASFPLAVKPASLVAFATLPGLVLCVVARWRKASKLATCGLLLGIIVCFYLPTLSLAIIHWFRPY
jgi:hypothetical protein